VAPKTGAIDTGVSRAMVKLKGQMEMELITDLDGAICAGRVAPIAWLKNRWRFYACLIPVMIAGRLRDSVVVCRY